MAVVGESSSALPKTTEDKPVIVRVKRKVHQSPLDAFWLEINERPQKRPLLDLAKLSLSDSPGKEAEELKSKKVFVRHVETVSSFDTTVDIVKSFVDPTTNDTSESRTKSEERRHPSKKGNKQDQILSKARQAQEVTAKNARFEQIWRSRKGSKEVSDEKLQEMCHFYDVIRVDVEERSNELKQQEELSMEDQRILQSYLPLLREFIPSAALEVESDLRAQNKVLPTHFPWYKSMMRISMMGLMNQNIETDDSNAENNPNFVYPDEESEDEERNRVVKHLVMNQNKMSVLVTDLQNPRI
ncbi:hypothetical protein M0R45_017563 [Rubus argutus]|uniref:Uncharacterized protein n=1 Tax=Rubus argutus TaxID=59490 RepID=A0AAW1XXX8_RUBAR